MSNPIEKNQEYVVEIIDYGADGEGIAKLNGYTIFVIGAIKNETCKIHITKVLTSYAYAKLIEVIKPSEYRVEPDCDTYVRCGGCDLRHISYKETLNIKREKVQNLVNKMLENKVDVKETIGMDNPLYYRNKAIFPISKDKEIGIYAERSHDIIPVRKCKIQSEEAQEVAKYIVENWNDTIYDEKTGQGLLRNIMIRHGFKTNELMVVLVQNGTSNNFDLKKLINKFDNIKTVVINVNTENTNVVLSRKNIVLYGNGKIKDRLGEYVFEISPNSFYQVNSIQTEKLYDLAIEKAHLKNSDVLCDLYCGIGTIGIFASKYVKEVYGIEIVSEAIEDAKKNAKNNNVNNIEFINGDVKFAFDELINKKHIKPDVVIVDPPRKGLDDKTIENLVHEEIERFVYVSCNPATLMRDLQVFEKNYEVVSLTPVDNFCYSSHIEVVAELKIR